MADGLQVTNNIDRFYFQPFLGNKYINILLMLLTRKNTKFTKDSVSTSDSGVSFEEHRESIDKTSFYSKIPQVLPFSIYR